LSAQVFLAPEGLGVKAWGCTSPHATKDPSVGARVGEEHRPVGSR
jgi:hypothetical protein